MRYSTFPNHFLLNYGRFENGDLNHKFDNEVQTLTQTTMGLEEQLLDLAEKKGIEKGMEKGIEKSIEIIALLRENKYSIEQIARMTGVTVSFVEKIRDSLPTAK